MWKGAIQFGLVTIPVKLYLATESRAGVSFHMLHEKDLSRIQMKVYCPVDEEVISRSDTVKGFEYAPDKYVVITDEDLEKLPLKTVRSIEIEQFVDEQEAEAQTRFVKQAYYLEPDKIGRKAFTLLKSVLEDKQLVAICKIVIRDREALAALSPFESTMLLNTLYWPDEVRALGELDIPDQEPEIKPAERAMAAQLVESMTGAFDPEQYRDEYREALMQVIEAKVEGKEEISLPQAEQTGNLVDLMAALQASVKAATEAREKSGAKPVSVAEAKAKKEARARTEKETPPKVAKKAGEAARSAKTAKKAERDDEERPARKRKTA
jgi:DNA end-binding protein Ku